MHPDDRGRVEASTRAAISSNSRYVLDYRTVRPDGSMRIIHDEAELVRDENGAPVRLIDYVNPAFELASGYRREAVIGQNPRILKSGRQSDAFYRALWGRLTRGTSWTGRFVNRRADQSMPPPSALAVRS